MERIALFIDGPAVERSVNVLGYELDYGALRTHFIENGDVLFRAYYFGVAAEDGEFDPCAPLYDFLEYNGFTIAGRVSDDPKALLAVEIAVKALTMAPHYDCAVIVSGDRELVPLVEALAGMGKRMIVAREGLVVEDKAEIDAMAAHIQTCDRSRDDVIEECALALDAQHQFVCGSIVRRLKTKPLN